MNSSISPSGKPIKLDDLVGVPEHLRMGYKILKNAGVLPEEMQLKKEMVSLKDLLDACYDETERQTLQQKMNEKMLRYNMMMEKQLPQTYLSEVPRQDHEETWLLNYPYGTHTALRCVKTLGASRLDSRTPEASDPRMYGTGLGHVAVHVVRCCVRG